MISCKDIGSSVVLEIILNKIINSLGNVINNLDII